MDYNNYLNQGNPSHQHPVTEYMHQATPHSQHAVYQQSLPLHQPGQMAYTAGALPPHFRVPAGSSTMHDGMQIDRSQLGEIGRTENVVTMVTVSEQDVHSTLLEMQNALSGNRSMGYRPPDHRLRHLNEGNATSVDSQLPPISHGTLHGTNKAPSASSGVPLGTPLASHTVQNKGRQEALSSGANQPRLEPLRNRSAPSRDETVPVESSPDDDVEGTDGPVREEEPLGGPLPEGLAYRKIDEKSVCVVADRTISKGVRFGPFRGAFGKGPIHFNNILSWELTLEGRVVGFLSPVKGEKAWTTLVRSAQYPDEQTAEAFQYCGRIYFRTIGELQAGEEFKVFYSDDYRESCGFLQGLADLKYNPNSKGFECSCCPCHCSNSKSLLRHNKLFHSKDKRPSINVEMPPAPYQRQQVLESADNENGLAVSRFICTTCGKSFPSQGRLMMHEKFHSNFDLGEEEEDYFPCENCGYLCLTVAAFEEHMAKHKRAPFGCDDCGHVSTTEQSLKAHRREHSGAAAGSVMKIKLRLKKPGGANCCKTCGYACCNKKELVAHTKQHKTMPFGCPECGCFYKQKKTLVSHLRDKHSAPVPRQVPMQLVAGSSYRCKTCRFRCPDVGSLKDHLKKHIIAPYGCDECGLVYTKKQFVMRHKREKHGATLAADHSLERPMSTPWECKECNKMYANVKSLTRHQKEKHGQVTGAQYKAVPARWQGPGEFECDLCVETFKTGFAFNAHLQNAHGIEPHPTDIKKGAIRATIQPHVSAAGGAKDLQSKSVGSTRCYICGKTFIKHSFLHDHLRQHHGIEPLTRGNTQGQEVPQETQVAAASGTPPPAEGQDKVEQIDMLGKPMDYYNRPRPFKCKLCPRRYAFRHILKRHEYKVHLGGSKFTCSFCQKGFDQESQLLVHIQTHTKNRPFKCHLCPRSFASQGACDNHQGEHTGAKPHKCDVCGRGFGTRKLMTKHKYRLHSNRERKHQCSFCEKRFLNKKDLKVHERRHKGIRPYVCLTCGKAFKDKHCRDVHTRIHTGEKPYACPQCGKAFSLPHRLTDHIVMHTKENMEQAAAVSTIVTDL